MPKPVVVVVDPVSTGAFCLDYLLKQDEFIVTTVWSPSISPAARALEIPGVNTTTHHIVSYTTLEGTCEELRQLHGDNIAHIVSLSEPGVETADELSALMKIPTSNGIKYSPHRRDKFKQLERLKECNLKIAKQQLVTTLDECIAFMCDLKATAVLKPATSAGSDDVFKIPYIGDNREVDFDLLTKRFNSTFNKINKMGIVNDVLIIQEFLQGEEFVIDSVSRDGEHKLVACWKYDKISIKDSGDFVYLGMSLCNAINNPKVDEMFSYIKQVLTALEVTNFCGHAELIYTATGCSLLEIGTRPHGGMGSFIPLQTHCLGYGIPELFYATLLGNKDNSVITPPEHYDAPRYFNEFPTLPPMIKKDVTGYQMDLVNYNPDGMLIGFNQEAMKTIEQLPTFITFTALPPVGKWLPTTYDCFTIPGSIVLAGDGAVLQENQKLIRELEKVLFVIEPCAKPE